MSVSIHISTGFWLLSVFFLLSVPAKWLLAACTAAAFHEICHIAAVYLSGGTIYGIRIGLSGARIDTESMSPSQELLCCVSGPAGSLLLGSLIHLCPTIGLCGIIQGLYNLLPIYPLDGWHMLHALLEIYLPSYAALRICILVEYTCLALLLVLGIWISMVLHMGFAPVLCGIVIIIRGILRKKLLQTEQSQSTIKNTKYNEVIL